MTASNVEPACLYVVATPIGCLADLSARAIDVLKDVDLIAAEDTRHSLGLLQHHGIRAHLISLHEHNEEGRVAGIVGRLSAGESAALISDAGTPLISDPGYRLVSAAHDAGLKVVPIPGPSAVLAALSVAGLPTDRFHFEGFLPAKGAKRRERLRELRDQTCTLVFFESSHRIRASLGDLEAVFGADRRACLARELTKRFETVRRDHLQALSAWLSEDSNQSRGEFVLVVEADQTPKQPDSVDLGRLIEVFSDELPPSRLAKVLAELTPYSKSEIYQRITRD